MKSDAWHMVKHMEWVELCSAHNGNRPPIISPPPEGRSPEKKLPFFWILSKLPPPPQFGQVVQLFSDVKIQDLKVS